MKVFIHTILLLLVSSLAHAQFYIGVKGDTISYKQIPASDDFMGQYILGDKVYKSYRDTIYHIEVQIPDSLRVERTGTPKLLVFEMPEKDELYDYISITLFSKDQFPVIDSLSFKYLTRHKKGEVFNKNPNNILKDLTQLSASVYKVELDCSGDPIIQQWRFLQNDYGYYVVMLAANEETYDDRLPAFETFVKQHLRLTLKP